MQRYNKNRYRLHIGSKFIAVSNDVKVFKAAKYFKDSLYNIGIDAPQKQN